MASTTGGEHAALGRRPRHGRSRHQHVRGAHRSARAHARRRRGPARRRAREPPGRRQESCVNGRFHRPRPERPAAAARRGPPRGSADFGRTNPIGCPSPRAGARTYAQKPMGAARPHRNPGQKTAILYKKRPASPRISARDGISIKAERVLKDHRFVTGQDRRRVRYTDLRPGIPSQNALGRGRAAPDSLSSPAVLTGKLRCSTRERCSLTINGFTLSPSACGDVGGSGVALSRLLHIFCGSASDRRA